MRTLDAIEKDWQRKKPVKFDVGDSVEVAVKIIEGETAHVAALATTPETQREGIAQPNRDKVRQTIEVMASNAHRRKAARRRIRSILAAPNVGARDRADGRLRLDRADGGAGP